MNSPDFQNLPTRLGIYTLTRHIGTGANTHLYLATQSHVERGVVIEVLPPGCTHEEVELFLATARARVAVPLPHVTQVVESMVTDDVWYLTQERPEGRNIAGLAKEKGSLSATQICHIIEAAAAMYRAAEERNVAAGGLAVHDIYAEADDRIHFLSPVQAGEHSAEATAVQQQALASVLQAYLPHSGPGQSRVATLTDWMLNGYEGSYLGWDSLAETARMIREQIAPQLRREHVSGLGGKTRGAIVRESKRNRRKNKRILALAGIGAAAVVAAAILGALTSPDTPDYLPANDGSTILCRQGNRRVEVAVSPVSIGEYKEFLNVFESGNRLNRDERRRLLADIPADGSTRSPAEWDAQWAAATQGRKYKGEPLSLSSPVRGVSYWDALVYARYKRAELPGAALLVAARREGNAEISVCEWTTDQSPATDIYKAGSIILPAQPGEPALLEPDRSARNTQYGFRLVYP